MTSLSERIEAAAYRVNSTHHFHGEQCLCGFSSPVSRDRTTHITDALTALLAPTVPAQQAQDIIGSSERVAWAERFLTEWARPYFGDDVNDAVACVVRAMDYADAALLAPKDAPRDEPGLAERLLRRLDTEGCVVHEASCSAVAVVYPLDCDCMVRELRALLDGDA